MNTTDISTVWAVVFVMLAACELVFKGFALWRAALRNEKGWFWVLLLINTAGILPIIYLLTKKKPTVPNN